MSYLDPLGGAASRNDRSSPADGDERAWAWHSGATPDPYADDRLLAGTAQEPAAAYPIGGFGVGEAAVTADGMRPDGDAAPGYPARPAAPLWVTADAALPADAEVVAHPRRTQRPPRPSADGVVGAVPVGPVGRAGRNLPAAIGVGLSLGAVILSGLFLWPPAFPLVIVAAASIGIWEMVRAIRTSGGNVPLVPLLAGGVLMVGLADRAGVDALTLGLLTTVLAASVWRFGDGRDGLRRDLAAILLICVYVPFLLGFAVLLVQQEDGGIRVLATVLAVVLSDTGGYASGVFLGKHPMAPSISPKKSWEGFGGSVLAAAMGSALLLFFAIGVPPALGALFGVAIAVVAVLGDLTESMMKRDLGIKDMSHLLPGHGGLMDRLDSILFAVPTAYLLLSLIA